METAEWFVGIDWAIDAHDVCVLNRDGQVVDRRKVAHTAAGLQDLVDMVLARAHGDPTRIVVGIETPRGALVDLCLERGLSVYAINPKQADRFRDRFTVGGAKDDRRDAEVIGDSLRTDLKAFRRVRLDDPIVIQLREWSHVDENLGADLIRLTNQLRDLVYRMAPTLLTLCPAANEPWFWTLLREAPTPAAQARLSLRRINRVLREHRIRRLTASDVRTTLQSPPLYTAPGVVEAVAAHITVVLPQVELVNTQRRHAERELERLLEQLQDQEAPLGDQREHRDVAIVRSMPGVGTRVAARMLAEASQPLADRAYHVLRVWSGVAPITKRSGQRRRPLVVMRYACNRRLREATYHWARAGAQNDPATKAHYAALRARGHTHGRALRGVADRLLRVLVALLTRGVLFDPTHGQTPASSAVA